MAWKPRASHEGMVEPATNWCTVNPSESGSLGIGGGVGGVGGGGGARCVRQNCVYVLTALGPTDDSPAPVLKYVSPQFCDVSLQYRAEQPGG